MVIILTAGYGEGHNAAARGLHSAFEDIGFESEIVDLFAQTGGAWYDLSRRAYREMIDRAPHLWAAIYTVVDRLPVVPMTLPAFRSMQRSLSALIATKIPLAIISVHPFYGYLVDVLFTKRPDQACAFHTVVTDSITINRVWHRCASDTFFVPNEETANVMIAAGVPKDKLRMFGFPVAPRFARAEVKRPHPEKHTRPSILFMVNSSRGLAPAVIDRLLENRGISVTATVGPDESLQRRITQIANGRPIEIHGWTNQMPELLMSHHLLIGKAGGAAVQEAIAARTPMLITHIIPGQEEGNARLLVEHGCGAICLTPEAITSKIEFLFRDGAAQWRKWEENITRLSKPDAAVRIARHVVGIPQQT